VKSLRHQIEQAEGDKADLGWKLEELTALVNRDYENAPLGHLQTWMQSEQVKAAASRTQGAYRLRDSAMVVLWRLDDRHRDGKSAGQCACGEPAAKCRDRALLAPYYGQLRKWEDAELARLKEGKPHGLPDDHPEVKKRSRTYTSQFRNLG
jgi:hypothetical protein